MTRKLETNEEAIKCLTIELGLRAEGYHSYLSHYGKQDKAEEEFLDSLQTAIAALREQPQWISVEERLPAPEVSGVLLWCGSYIELGWYDNEDGVWRSDLVNDYEGDVTHWMPLPEPPKEEV